MLLPRQAVERDQPIIDLHVAQVGIEVADADTGVSVQFLEIHRCDFTAQLARISGEPPRNSRSTQHGYHSSRARNFLWGLVGPQGQSRLTRSKPAGTLGSIGLPRKRSPGASEP